MNPPKISVLMPAYNTEKYITEAIESILNQTFSDFEFIIIDDGSMDNTWGIIQKYLVKDSRIRAWRQEQNQGISITRNNLVAGSSAPYIVWQDSDDISLPKRLELQYEYMEKNPNIGISGGYLRFFSEKGDQGIRRYASEDSDLRRKIFQYSPVAQPASIIRRACFKDVEPYDPRWLASEDLNMSFKIGRKWKFGNLSTELIRYREQSSSITFKKLRRLERNTLRIRYKFAKDPAYHLTAYDVIYNLLQALTLYLMPTRMRVAIFNLIRNS